MRVSGVAEQADGRGERHAAAGEGAQRAGVPLKSLPAPGTRAWLTAHKLLQAELHDLKMNLRGSLRDFGLKVDATIARTFEAHIRDLRPATSVLSDEACAAANKASIGRVPRCRTGVARPLENDDIGRRACHPRHYRPLRYRLPSERDSFKASTEQLLVSELRLGFQLRPSRHDSHR